VRKSKRDVHAEQLLIEKSQDGSPEAFAELAETYTPWIYGISLRYLENYADAEDNVQNTLIKAYQNIYRFEGRSRFSTWLIRITINEALMTIRRRRRENLILESDLPAPGEASEGLEIENGDPCQERQYIAKELVAQALQGLPSALVEVFLLHKAEGWTQRDLARQNGISLAALKSRICSARMRIHERLQDLGWAGTTGAGPRRRTRSWWKNLGQIDAPGVLRRQAK
jgi:RNA polymerase sigma-70 factor, ECF subfamily